MRGSSSQASSGNSKTGELVTFRVILSMVEMTSSGNTARSARSRRIGHKNVMFSP